MAKKRTRKQKITSLKRFKTINSNDNLLENNTKKIDKSINYQNIFAYDPKLIFQDLLKTIILSVLLILILLVLTLK